MDIAIIYCITAAIISVLIVGGICKTAYIVMTGLVTLKRIDEDPYFGIRQSSNKEEQ